MARKSRYPYLLLVTLSSALFLVLAVWRIDWHRVYVSFQSAHWYPWLPLGIAAYLTGQLVRGVRLKVLVSSDANLSVIGASNIVIVGYAVNNILPARLGEFVRAKVLSDRTRQSYVGSLAITLVERLMDGLAILFILCVAGRAMVGRGFIGYVAAIAGSVLGGALIFVTLTAMRPELLLSMVSFVTQRLDRKTHALAVRTVMQVIAGVGSLGSPRKSALVFLLSLVVWSFESGLYWFMLPCFNLPWRVTTAAITMSLTNLALLIPSSPGFVGTFHYFCMQSLQVFGVEPALALSYAVVAHLAFYVPVTIWGLTVLTAYGVDLAKAGDLAVEARSNVELQ